MEVELEVKTESRGRRSEGKRLKMERQKEEAAKLRNEREKEYEEKFHKVLSHCKEFISSPGVYTDAYFFDLLDPLISDNQCHLHALLLIDILRKCYNSSESTYSGIEKLHDKDKEILSYGVLFTLLKVDYRDNIGCVIHQVSIRNFGCLLLPSKKKEWQYIADAKKKFNSISVDHIRNVAKGGIKDILTECHATARNEQQMFVPFYASMYAIIAYLKEAKLPIIVLQIDIGRQEVEGSRALRYNINSTNVHFYEFQEETNKFCLKENLTDFEKELPTTTFEISSLTNSGVKKHRLDCDIQDILLASAAGTHQLPKSAGFPEESGCRNREEYVNNLYEKHADIFNQYNEHYKLAKEFNLNTSYAKVVQTSIDPETGDVTFAVERSNEDYSYRIDHLYLSSYSHEQQRREYFDINSQVDRNEVHMIQLQKIASEVARRWVV